MIDTLSLCTALASGLQSRGWMLATAESCTGGLIAASCTALAGSSAWFDRGFVTYSNRSKTELLGVPSVVIENHGAVSDPVACAMASGAIRSSQACTSIAVTGIAGPSGGSIDKPVGTVWFAWYVNGQLGSERCIFSGDRASIRESAVQHAIEGLLMRLD